MAVVKAGTQYGADWGLNNANPASNQWSGEDIQIILLQEIRDELKKLNALLGCPNFTNIPKTLRTIARQTKLETPDALSTVRTASTSTRKRRST